VELLSRAEAAKLLGVTDRHIDRLAKREGLPVVRMGRRVLIPRCELEKWLRARIEKGGGNGQKR